ncbi:hypothetical protein, conserved [Eimeria brunetti]|uniref:Uncharacterized protein n=1 Tax=Eimeria brunetti TaxID=51314 RepID=U6LNC8_9EIME|nr:hypothetical protein, conserved [Eimeria brunetti]
MTALGPTVRPVALSVFTCINIVLCWLWFQGTQVERHDLPDPCSYLSADAPPLLALSATAAAAAAEDAVKRDESEGSAATTGSVLKNCTVSTAAVSHLQQWQRQLRWHSRRPRGNAAPLGELPFCPPTSPSHGELLQWNANLRVVPLCLEAESAARQVYRHLVSLGEPSETKPLPLDQTCTAIPVASVLEAAGREVSPLSGSANALLAVRLLPVPSQPTASCAADAASLRADLSRASAQALEAGDPEGLSTLQLFVTAPLGEGATPRLHIGAGSTVLLVVPRSSSSNNSNASKTSDITGDGSHVALQQVAAEAAVQALGRWVLSPPKAKAPVFADLRLRLWLLGDIHKDREKEADAYFDDEEEEERSMSEGVEETETAVETAAVAAAAGGPPSGNGVTHPPPPTLTWDCGGFLRMHMGGFLEAVSTLIDLHITSQVVPDSGLDEMDWDIVRRGWGVGGRVEEAFQEETARRLLNLQEQWGSDSEYSPSASVVNLSLYRPSAPTEAWPLGSALALPSWGFITFGESLPQLGSEPLLGPDSNFSSPRVKEAVAVSGAWIAQLRTLLGLQPTPELLLQEGPEDPDCSAAAGSALCGKPCRAQRCAWRVERAYLTDPTDRWVIAQQQRDTSDMFFSDADFALMPTRAALVADRGPAGERVEVYLHPSSKGLTEWELDGLAAEVHFRMITQAAKNIQMLHTVLLQATDTRVTKHVADTMRGVLNLIQCSLQALRMKQCPTLPAAAKDFLLGSDIDVCPMKDSDEAPLLASSVPPVGRVGGCGGSPRGSSLGKAAVYRQLALLLARAAIKDSKGLLTDESIQPAPFFSLHFNLAVHVPLLLPFVLPTLVSLFRAAKFALKK